MHRAETALNVGERAAQKNDNLFFGERFEHIDAAARQQRAVDFERRIFGRGSDQPNAAFFHVRQEGILLRFVEAVNFVDEDDGARAVLAGAIGIAHDLLDFLDAREHGGELDEVGFGHAGDDFGERRLARARRSPEDHRRGIVALDLHAQRFARADELLLPDEFIECARAHAVGERTGAFCGGVFGRDGSEEIHTICNLQFVIGNLKPALLRIDLRLSNYQLQITNYKFSLRLRTARCWRRLRH